MMGIVLLGTVACALSKVSFMTFWDTGVTNARLDVPRCRRG